MKTRLLKAICGGDGSQKAKQILRSNPSQIFSFDSKGRGPLHKAVEQGDYDLVDYLIVWGASPNAKDAMGHTPLHLAIIHGQFKIAKLLIANNAFVNSVSATGKTPLHFLANHEESEEVIEVAKYLLSLGAHPLKKDQKELTAIDQAEKNNNFVLREVYMAC